MLFQLFVKFKFKKKKKFVKFSAYFSVEKKMIFSVLGIDFKNQDHTCLCILNNKPIPCPSTKYSNMFAQNHTKQVC